MYLGGHLQREQGEYKVYGYSCSFSTELGKHLFYQCTIVPVVHKAILSLKYIYCFKSYY